MKQGQGFVNVRLSSGGFWNMRLPWLLCVGIVIGGGIAAQARAGMAQTSDPYLSYGIFFPEVFDLLLSGHGDDALAELARIVASNRNNPLIEAEALVWKADYSPRIKKDYTYERSLTDLKEAEKAINQVEGSEPAKKVVEYELASLRARAYWRIGDLQKARDAYMRLIKDKEVPELQRSVCVGALVSIVQADAPHDKDAAWKVMADLIESKPGALVEGAVYDVRARMLMEQQRYGEAERDVDLASEKLGYSETYELRSSLETSEGRKAGPPLARDAVYYELRRICAQCCPKATYGLMGVCDGKIAPESSGLLPMVTIASRAASEALSNGKLSGYEKAALHIIKAIALVKENGQYGLALKELDEGDALDMNAARPSVLGSLKGYTRYVRGQICEAQGKADEASGIYVTLIGNSAIAVPTRQIAVSALVSLVGKQSKEDPTGAVASEMDKLLENPQPAEFRGQIDVAWGEWLTENGDFDAAAKKLDEAAKMLGEKSLDVNEGLFRLKKTRASKEAH